MPKKDIFDKPFDEGTLAKLEIFEKYFEDWLPPFVIHDFKKPIQVFDFFAGSGYDKNGIPGSPIRIITTIKKHSRILRDRNKQIYLYLNDINLSKIEKLKNVLTIKIEELDLTKLVIPFFTNLPFSECLGQYIHYLKKGCNLIFIDQNGFKEVNESVFGLLMSLEMTEFIFFISSTHIHRFANLSEVQRHHPKFDFDKIKNTSRKRVHNVICEEFEKYVPKKIKSYGVIPFSIMKDDHNNVYGLIFVSKHILGADKFLHTVWRGNALNGNANYDIEEDQLKDQLHLFDGKSLTKLEIFQNELCKLILNGQIKNNVDAYLFTLNQGHISAHANEQIKRMKKEKLITFESNSSLVNYVKVIKEKRILDYKLMKNEAN
jgi:three-Cys-motif partner protein